MKTQKKVMVFGTFDLLHKGHVNFLMQAKKHGRLIVVVARDVTVQKVKNRTPVDDERTRKRKVQQTGIADKVMLGSLGNKYAIIEKERPDVICIGYDQTSFTDGLKEALKSMGSNADVKRMKAHMPEKYKTSIIMKKK